MIKKQRRDTLRHTVTVTADRQTRGRQRHADLLIYRPVLETPSHHTTTGSPPSVERQKKHQHHIDDDEEEQDDKDHDPLGLRVHVAAEESVKRTPFVPASLGGLCHSFSPQRKKKKKGEKKTQTGFFSDCCTAHSRGTGGGRGLGTKAVLQLSQGEV